MNRPVLSLGWTSEQDICQSHKPESYFDPSRYGRHHEACEADRFATLSIGPFSNLIAQTIADLP